MAEPDLGFQPEAAAAPDDFGFTPLFQSDPTLAAVRTAHAQELNDPHVAGQLYSLTHREVGSQGPEAQQAFMETVFNRAAARGATLAATVSDPNYYPGQSLRRTAFKPEEVTRYQQMALNAAQGSNVSNYATGNASGSVGFAGGPQTFRAGGERFGIEGPDKNWIPRARQADVQEVRIEKGEAVTPVEMQVARAKPVDNQFGFVPEAPAAAAPGPKLPGEEQLTSLAGTPYIAGTSEVRKALPKDAPSLWHDTLDYFDLNKQAQPPDKQSIGAKILAQAGQKLQSMIPRSPLQWAGFATPVVGAVQELIKTGSELPKEWDNAKAGLAGKPLPHPEVMGPMGGKTYDKFTKDDWLKFGVDVGTDLLMGAGAAFGLREATAGPAPRVTPTGEMVAGPAVAEPGAAPTGGAAAPTAEAAAAAGPRPIFTNVADELRWLRKNAPAEYESRFAEEIAKRQQGEYDVRHDTEPVGPTQPAAAAAPDFGFVPEQPATPETAPVEAVTPPEQAPTAAAPPAPAALAAPEAPPSAEAVQWEAMPPETRLAALSHVDPQKARLSPELFTAMATSNWNELSPREQADAQATLRTLPADWAPKAPAPGAPAPGEELEPGPSYTSTRPQPSIEDWQTKPFESAIIQGAHHVQNAAARWADLRNTGASDEQLQAALSDEFGISGGYSSPDIKPNVSWTGGKNPRVELTTLRNPDKPVTPNNIKRETLKGKQLLDTARQALNIPRPEEITAEAEHRAEMERTGQEAIAAQGGMELLDAVQHEGGLPVLSHPGHKPYRGELKMLRETVRGTKGVRYRDVFSSKSRGVDDLAMKLRARGFDIETPHQLIAAIEHRIRTGIPHYALPEAGETLFGPAHVGETPPEQPPAPKPSADTAKLAEDVQTFLDFNNVPAPRKPKATEEINKTLAIAGDPALQKFYASGFAGVPGPELAQALRANKNRVSIIYADLISRERPTWNIEGSIIANAADLATAVQPIRSPDFESFKVIARDSVTKTVLSTEITSTGTLNEALVHMRDVMRIFARMKEKYPNVELIVSHNHPSGKPRPSDPDRSVQRKLHTAAAAQGVKLVDHVITNGKEYFSFEQEEVTGDGYGTLPKPVLQPWEVVRQQESPRLSSPDDLEKFTATLRADDPNAAHIFYTGTQMNLIALERVSQGTSLHPIKKAIANGISRESAFGVLVDFATPPPLNVITDLVHMVHDAMGAKLLDVTWPGVHSARAAGSYGLRRLEGGFNVAEQPYGRTSPIQRREGSLGAIAEGETPGPGLPQLAPLSEMERTALEALERAKETLSPAGKRKLARLQARRSTQGELLGGEAFNLSGEQQIDWVARQAQAEAAEAARAEAQQAAEKAQMSLFEKPDMPYVTGTARVNESNGAAKGPPGPPGASMFAPNTPPRSNPQPLWAQRYAAKFRKWWQEKLPRSWEIVRKVRESPVITEHQRLLEAELSYMNEFTNKPWWQALRRRTEEEIIDLEHQAVTGYRGLVARGTPREAAWAQAVAKMPPDMQALFQHRETRVPMERWAAGQLAIDEPSYTGDPYLARLTNEEGKAVVDLQPQIANWGRHIRQSIGSFDKSRVHATMKEGILKGTQYEPPTMAAFVRELYSTRLEGTARMLQALKQKGVLFTEKADALAAAKALKKDAGPVTLVRGFGGKDYWARSRVEAQFLSQNLNTTNSAGSIGKLVRVANAFTRNPNLLFNPLPHATKNMAFKYALARIGNYTLAKSAREYGTNAQMRARFEAVMPMPATGVRLPQLRALEAGTYLERMVAKTGKVLSGNHLSARFNFAKADPALRYALWKTYVKKGLSDQAAANHVWVDLIRYDENSGALNFWRGIPFNFFATWRLGTYISLAKQLRSHPLRTMLFIGALEYLREILYRKFGWWTHLPVDYVDAPLAEAIRDPRTIPGVAATTLLFGPGGAQAPHTINDVMKTLHGDPGNLARVVNMFWGISQLFNLPQEFNAYLKDKDPKHLALMLQSAALSTHSALKYQPHRLMQWLPETMPGMEKSAIVRQAEALQAKIEAKTEKARGTYEARHGIGATLEYRTEAGQMEALRRAAGVHPPKPGPPKRTKIIPSPRSSGKPRGF